LLKRFGPEEIFGYASSLYLLAQAFQRNHIQPVRTVKVVASTSEVMYPNWRECIQQVFGAPVADQYGSQELQCLITQCPQGTLHINPEFGIVEVVDDDLAAVPPGQEGQMLLTGLANDAMPLIRYQIGDRSALMNLPGPCKCGLHWPAIQPVSGRSEDAIRTPDGRPLMYLNFHCTKTLTGIVESQFIQDRQDHIKILLVVDNQFTPASEKEMISNLRQRAQYDFKVDVEYVDRIPRGNRGKFKAVINLLNEGQGKVT
jgi:phenylacetate-CoA ligase